MRVGFVLAALLPLAAALVPALRASHGGRSSLRRRLAPRDVLEAEFDRLAQGQPVVVVDAAAAAPLLAELIDDGDLGADELRQMWGPGARDRAGFVALCEAVGDLFEDEDEAHAFAKDETAVAAQNMVFLRRSHSLSLEEQLFVRATCPRERKNSAVLFLSWVGF